MWLFVDEKEVNKRGGRPGGWPGRLRGLPANQRLDSRRRLSQSVYRSAHFGLGLVVFS